MSADPVRGTRRFVTCEAGPEHNDAVRQLAMTILNDAYRMALAPAGLPDRGVRSTWLETSQRWPVAYHLYGKYGFMPVHCDELPPDFPVVRVATGCHRLELRRAMHIQGGNP